MTILNLIVLNCFMLELLLTSQAPGAFWNQTIYSFSAVDQTEFERQLRELPINTSISARITLFKMAKA